jgi:phage shock protein PspC (stress-responsive transcriptional regulator)
VCGGLGRATNTDPVLWRVLLGALVVFGILGHWPVAALGILAYLAAWLVLPAEGDDASALEALLSRGTSSVSSTVTIVLLVGSALVASTLLGTATLPAALLLASAAVLAYHLYRNGQLRARPAPSATPPVPPGAPVPPGEPVPPGAATPGEATTQVYAPAFAPHGPYAYPVAPTPWTPPAVTAPPRPPKPPKERSALGRLTVSLVFLAIGGLAVADLLVLSIPASTYFAVALAVVALGLLVGAVAGRARGLIALGLLLTLGLAGASAPGRIETSGGKSGDVTFRPATAAQVQDRYEHGFGNVTLDLRHVVPRGPNPLYTRIQSNAGTIVVQVDPNVDVTVDARVGAGQMDVLGHHAEGLGRELRFTDGGNDGGGGQRLNLSIELVAGNVEVRREEA